MAIRVDGLGHPMGIPENSVEDAFLAYRRTRDPAALAAVYDGTSSRMLAVALHLAGSAAAAEDAVQDTFLFALENPERWDETRPLVPWLLGILANRLRQTAYRAQRAPDPERLQLPDVRDPESELEANELLKQIEEAITRLAQPYRTIVLLRLRNGLSPADIAVALDRKPSTVRAQLTRGVEMLRKVLPAGVAGLLVGSLALTGGLSAARNVVLKRAHEVQRAIQLQAPSASLQAWLIGAAACAAAVLLVWFAMPGTDAATEPPSTLAASDEYAAEPPSVVRASVLSLPGGTSDSEVQRQPLQAVGSLTVRVSRRGMPMPRAEVEIEPLGHPPQAFMHQTSTKRGQWREIVPARPNPIEAVYHARTATDGSCQFGELPPGHWVCRALGVAEVVEVQSGVAGTMDIDVGPRCCLVRGRVLDPQGTPLVNASVWTCREHVLRVRRVVAKTDAAGRFELAVAAFTTVGAQYPGFAPVAMSVGRVPDAPPLQIVLRFDDAGAAVTGRVLDADGNPVAGADVEVGHARDTRVSPNPLTPQVIARPQRTRTDMRGRFSFDSLVPGQTFIATCAAGYGLCGQVVELVAGEVADVSLTLPLAATIEGHVLDETGQPIAGVRVHIGPRNTLGYRSALTDRAGAYRLSDVTPGSALVQVTDYRGGFKSRVHQCRPGERVVWNPVLSPRDLLLAGRVVTAEQLPCRGAWVAHIGRSGKTVVQVDNQGRFSIRVSEREAAHTASLHVFDRDPRDAKGAIVGSPRASRGGLTVGADEVLIELPPQEVASAGFVGRVVDAAGHPAPGEIVLSARGRGQAVPFRLDPLLPDGSFSVGPLAAGSYTIRVVETGDVLGPFKLPSAETRDLGVLRIGPAQSVQQSRAIQHIVQLAVLWPLGADSVEIVRMKFFDPAGALVRTRHHAGGGHDVSSPYVWLPAGRYRVVAETPSGLTAERELVVDSAQRLRAALLRLR